MELYLEGQIEEENLSSPSLERKQVERWHSEWICVCQIKKHLRSWVLRCIGGLWFSKKINETTMIRGRQSKQGLFEPIRTVYEMDQNS